MEGTTLVVVAIALLLGICVRPLRQQRADDSGDGKTFVVLPRPRSVTMARVISFYVYSSVFTLLLVEIKPGPVQLYRDAVGRASSLTFENLQAILPYADHVSAALRLVVVANLAAFSIVVRASVARRLCILSNVALFLVIAILLDALGCAAAARVDLPTETASLLGSVLILFVAVMVTLRLLATTFMVPKPTAVPDLRAHHRSEAVLLVVAAIFAVVAALGLVDLSDTLLARYHPTAFLVAFIGLPLTFDFFFLFLLVTTRSIRPPRCLDRLPPITTITPAFNEQETIARTLESIDRAAGRYRGEVTVVLSDDGSDDATIAVAARVMERFRHAHGRLIAGRHGGKAAALNKALRMAATDIVVRIDADVVIAEDAFTYLPDWFANPSVGMVGALALPDQEADSWYARGRLFECLVGFGFARVALQRWT